MFAILAVVAFALALILRLLGGHAALVDDIVIAGLLCVALHLVYAVPLPWRRP